MRGRVQCPLSAIVASSTSNPCEEFMKYNMPCHGSLALTPKDRKNFSDLQRGIVASYCAMQCNCNVELLHYINLFE